MKQWFILCVCIGLFTSSMYAGIRFGKPILSKSASSAVPVDHEKTASPVASAKQEDDGFPVVATSCVPSDDEDNAQEVEEAIIFLLGLASASAVKD